MSGRPGRIFAARAVVALLLLGCASGTGTGARIKIRALTYNIHAGADAGGQPNLERVAALLDSLDADVVLLQEVDRGTERSGRVDQLALLERLTARRGAFAKSLDYQGGEYGIAALSRWPIAWARTVPLPVEPPQARAGGAVEPRVGLHLLLTTPAGPLHVLNTHLDPSGPGTYRRQELVGLLAYVTRSIPRDAPLVLGGDLNARPGTDEIAALSLALEDAWRACGRGEGATFPASAPDRRIDYLFLRRAGCRSAQVIPTQASDHRPVLVLLEVP